MSDTPNPAEPSAPIRVQSRLASARDQFLLQWGRESLKQSVPAINDVLAKLLPLLAALFGGALVVIEKSVVTSNCGVVVLVLLLLSLCAVLAGLYPRRWGVGSDLDNVLTVELRAADRKALFLRIAFALLALAFVAVIIGVLVAPPKTGG